MESIGAILDRELTLAEAARCKLVPVDMIIDLRSSYFVIWYPWYRGVVSTLYVTCIFGYSDFHNTLEGVSMAVDRAQLRAEKEKHSHGVR